MNIEEIYKFCKGHYYSVFTEDEETLWEPFENWSEEDVEEQIQADVLSMVNFLREKGIEVENE